MKFLIRDDPMPIPRKLLQRLVRIIPLRGGKGIPWFQIFFTIKTSCLYKCNSSLYRTRKQDEISWKELFTLYLHYFSYMDVTPLYLDEFVVPEYLCF
jgi:hypothetical protein